ncbi:beta-galactosidase 9-like, partial [Trifolium medium]|nr:beta-galactosidase 9-like [Trifolium medium]
ACLGKRSCSIKISGAVFGDDPCKDVAKTLSVEARCTSPSSTDGSFQL